MNEIIKNIPDEKLLLENIGKIAYSLDRAYMSRLREDYKCLPFSDYLNEKFGSKGKLELQTNTRAVKVYRWVYDREEDIRDCFKNILGLFAGGDHSVALVIKRTMDKVEMYYVVNNEFSIGGKKASEKAKLLNDSICGNFPGSKTELIGEDRIISELEFGNIKALSLLSGIPSEKSEDYLSQTIDRLLNGIVPTQEDDNYFLVILANPLNINELREVLSNYESMASALIPFSSYQYQLSRSSSETKGTSESNSHSIGKSYTKSKTKNINVHASVSFSKEIKILKVKGTATATVGGGYGYTWGSSITDSITDMLNTGSNESMTSGESESTTYTHKSYLINDLIEKLEAMIKRVTESQSTGLWQMAAYSLSNNVSMSYNVINFLNSIMQGDMSYLERSHIQSWYQADDNKDFNEILNFVKRLIHPVFANKLDNTLVSPTSNVSTNELSNIVAFPRYSVPGLPIIECARFGREPHSLNNLSLDLMLGHSYHMYKENINKSIKLEKEKLTAHTFITGSTGSGKSNAIYSIIDQLSPDIPFLVIEPAKGEYKHAFGNRKDVSVYGTNPYLGLLLRINPFRFNKDIHILEHLDRLIEIFNVCWPMYAAMPAVLKQAVEYAYEQTGWDLKTSKNKYNDLLFPTFKDVCTAILSVINTSEYSEENKGNYKGALVTRLNSLTNGLNGLIFVDDELSDLELFDKNTIVDLSRVGSIETKALIMGILIMKLQEYRMTSGIIDSPLQHLTILEEAHNLLKRTSSEQSSDTANLLGKSVEMLANSIAEMRTYGEGFIIADQSPGLLDMSVIRNTNTKIILRLPDESDRELVGRAASLNDDQIVELARLQLGVAAVYQNDWIQPVLCKVSHFKKSIEERYKPPVIIISNLEPDSNETAALKKEITKYLLTNVLHERKELSKEKVAELRNNVLHSKIDAVTKVRIFDFISKYKTPPESIEPIVDIIGGLYSCPNEILNKVIPGYTLKVDWAKSFCEGIYPAIHNESDFSWEEQKYIMQCIAIKLSIENVRFKDLPKQLNRKEDRII